MCKPGPGHPGPCSVRAQYPADLEAAEALDDQVRGAGGLLQRGDGKTRALGSGRGGSGTGNLTQKSVGGTHIHG